MLFYIRSEDSLQSGIAYELGNFTGNGYVFWGESADIVGWIKERHLDYAWFDNHAGIVDDKP